MKNKELKVKRLIDLFGSIFGLFILSPLLLLTMVLIKITMPGPIFFTQERVGKDGKLFNIIKFRTMKVDQEAEKAIDCSKDQQRLTGLGKFLRRSKIDELPQLINVLLGDMSLVGPRPTLKRQVDRYSEYEFKRLATKPGMTGLAQINGGTSIPWKERIDYDIRYVAAFSLSLDMKIIFKTFLVIFCGEKEFQKDK